MTISISTNTVIISTNSIDISNLITKPEPSIVPEIQPRSAHRLSQHSFTYHRYQEMICRVKSEELAILNTKLAQLPEKQAKIDQLCDALAKGDWQNEIFTSPNLPYYALEAFRIGNIDEYQFGTIQLFWSIGQYHKGFDQVQMYSFYTPEGDLYEYAIDYVISTLGLENSVFWELRFLSKDQFFNQFLPEIKKLPLSEQYFFLIPDLQGNQKDEEDTTVSQQIYHKVKLNVFNRVGKNLRMIPSLGMMQTFLKVKYGENTVKINPVLGLSNIKQLRQIELRDMALHFPGIELSDEADNFFAPWYDFSYHDFYHAIVASGAPITHRILMIRVADIALEIMREKSMDSKSPQGETLRSFANSAIDMELPFYRDDLYKLAPQVRFWLEIGTLTYKSFANPRYKFFDVLTFISFYERLAQKLILQNEGGSIGLTKEALKEACKHLSNRVFLSKIGDLHPLKLMSKYLEQQNPELPKKLIKPGLKVLANKQKFLTPFAYPRIRKTMFEKIIAESQFKTLPADIKNQLQEEIKAVVSLDKAGIPLTTIIALEPEKRNKVFQEYDSLVQLIVAGISWDQIMSLPPITFKYIVDGALSVATLLEIGTTWEQIIECPYLNEICHNKYAINHLLKMGASFDEILALISSNLGTLLFDKALELGNLVDANLSYKTLIQLDHSMLKLLLNKSFVIKAITEELEIDELLTIPLEKLKILLKDSYILPELMGGGTVFKQLIKLDIPKLKSIWENSTVVIRLIKEKVTNFAEIAKVDSAELDLLSKYSNQTINLLRAGVTFPEVLAIKSVPLLLRFSQNSEDISRLIRLGISFDQIRSFDQARYSIFITHSIRIRELVQMGVSLKKLTDLNNYELSIFCSDGARLLEANFSYEWVTNIFKTEKDLAQENQPSRNFYFLAHFITKGVSTETLSSLSIEELGMLLNKAFQLSRQNNFQELEELAKSLSTEKSVSKNPKIFS